MEITARSASPGAMKTFLPCLSDSPPIKGIIIAREIAKPENIMPIQIPEALRSSAMVGNIGEIILNPKIAAIIVKYRVNNVRRFLTIFQAPKKFCLNLHHSSAGGTRLFGDSFITALY